MTEQMTGRKGPAGTERPAAADPRTRRTFGSQPAGPGRPLAAPPTRARRRPAAPGRAPRRSGAGQPGAAPGRAASGRGRPAQAPPRRTPRAGRRAEPPRAHVTSPGKMRATGAQALVYALERVGADVVFGIPGGAVLPAYDPLLDSKVIRHILVRHEQGAGHAATGYAQATGRVGVCMATSGPGATNLVTPIADAYMDSVPIVAITGQVPSQPDRHRRLPGGRHLRDHHPDHQAQFPRHQARGHRPHHRRGLPRGLDRAAGAGAGRHLQGRDAGDDRFQLAGYLRPARLPPGDPAARPAGARGRAADQRGQAPGALRRRRRDQGPRRRPAARARRADRHPGGHHADGPGRVPRPAPAAHGHARHARHGGGGRRAAAGRPAHRARHQVRRPGDRQAGHVRARGADRARGHRPGRDLQEPPRRRADRRRLPRGDRRPGRRGAGPSTSRAAAPT